MTNKFSVSAEYSYSAWHYGPSSHHEGCDCVESYRDLVLLCDPPAPVPLQPVLADGTLIVEFPPVRKGLHSKWHCVLKRWLRGHSYQSVCDC